MITSNDNRLYVMTDVVKPADIVTLIKHAEFQMQQGYDTIKKIIQKYDNGFRPNPKQTAPASNTSTERETEYTRERIK